MIFLLKKKSIHWLWYSYLNEWHCVLFCFFIYLFLISRNLPTMEVAVFHFGKVHCNSTGPFACSDILSMVKQLYRFPQVWLSSVLKITLCLLSGPALLKCPAALAFQSHLTALDWKEKGKSLIFQELSWAYNKIISSPSKWMEPTVHC